MQKVLKPNFAAAWEEIGESNELEDTYGLSSMKSVEGQSVSVIYLLVALCSISVCNKSLKSTQPSIFLVKVNRVQACGARSFLSGGR